MSEQIINAPQGVTPTTTVTAGYSPGDGVLVVASTAPPYFPASAPFHFVVWSAATGLALLRFKCTAITDSTHLAVTVESGDTDVALPVNSRAGFCLTSAGIAQYVADNAGGGAVTSVQGLTGAVVVTDANLSTSDVTTNNSSTSKHGFLKKLDGNSSHYMDGSGAWSTPSGGGGGGGGIFPTLTPPVAADFAWTNQLSTVVTDFSNRETFSMPTDATDPNWRLWISTASLPAHHQVTGGFSQAALGASSYWDFGVFLRDSGSGAFTFFGLDSTSPNVRVVKFNSVTSAASVTDLGGCTNFNQIIFFRIRDDGTTRTYEISSNGNDFYVVFSEGSGTFVTPDQGGIGMANFTGATAGFGCYHFLIESV